MSTIAETEFLQQPEHYLQAVRSGEILILSEAGEPTAMVLSLAPAIGTRQFGIFQGEITVPSDFNEPLPEAIMDAFSARLL